MVHFSSVPAMAEGMLLYSLRREVYFIFRRMNNGYNVSIVLLRWNSKTDPSCCGFSFTFFLVAGFIPSGCGRSGLIISVIWQFSESVV